MCTSKWWITIGAVLGGLGVTLGAMAAHGLDKNVLVPNFGDMKPKVVAGEELPARAKYLRDFKTAAEYQMYHALAIIAVGLLAERRYNRALAVAGTSFLLGVLLFSGSLYLLVVTGRTNLGAITPFGGVAFIVGWVALAIGAAPAKAACAIEHAASGSSGVAHNSAPNREEQSTTPAGV